MSYLYVDTGTLHVGQTCDTAVAVLLDGTEELATLIHVALAGCLVVELHEARVAILCLEIRKLARQQVRMDIDLESPRCHSLER